MGLVLFGTITYAEVSQEDAVLQEVLVNNIKEVKEYSQGDRTTEQMIHNELSTSKGRTTPSVISVDIPTHINMTIDPYEKMGQGAIVSEEIKMMNYSEVPVDINLMSFQVHIPEASEVVYTGLPILEGEEKSLGLYLWNEESKMQFNLYEGMNLTKLDTLTEGQECIYTIKGKVNNMNVNWNKEDRINAEFIFTINSIGD